MSVQSGRVRALRIRAIRARPCDPCEAGCRASRPVRDVVRVRVASVRVEKLSEKREVWDMQTMVHRPRRAAARTTDDTRHTALIDFDSALVTHCKGSWPEPCGTGSDWLE